MTVEAERAAPPATRGLGGVPPVALVLAAIGSVQTGAALAVMLFDRTGPAGASFLRVAIAALLLWALVRPRIRGRSSGELALAAAFGLLLAGMNTCFYLALDRIPQGGAVTLEFAGPLAVALAFSRRALDVVWVVLAGSGIALLSGAGIGRSDALGIAFALAAGCLWAGYILAGARLVRRFPGATGLTVAMAAGAVALVPAGIADGGSALADPTVLGLGAAVSVLSSVVPYSFELEALRRMPQRVFGVLMSLEPAVAALTGFAILGQRLPPLDALAIGLVVVASAGVALTGRAAVEPTDVPAPAAPADS